MELTSCRPKDALQRLPTERQIRQIPPSQGSRLLEDLENWPETLHLCNTCSEQLFSDVKCNSTGTEDKTF